MRKLFFLLIPAFLFAEILETPPKLRAFIDKNIGIENFFKGANGDKNEITVKKTKDWSYYSFDLYKSVEMGIGVKIDKNNTAGRLRLDGQNYTLLILHKTVDGEFDGQKKSTVIFLFKKEIKNM